MLLLLLLIFGLCQSLPQNNNNYKNRTAAAVATKMAATNDSRRRVKFYVLNDMRQWDDKGTGYVSWVLNDKQRSVSIIVKSEIDGNFKIHTLLDSKIVLIPCQLKAQYY